MCAAKSAELRKELEVLAHTFERQMDAKDGILRALAADLDEADQQTLRASQTHAAKVDEIVAFHSDLVERV